MAHSTCSYKGKMATDISANRKNKYSSISSIFYENLNLFLLTGAVSGNESEKPVQLDF